MIFPVQHSFCTVFARFCEERRVETHFSNLCSNFIGFFCVLVSLEIAWSGFFFIDKISFYFLIDAGLLLNRNVMKLNLVNKFVYMSVC